MKNKKFFTLGHSTHSQEKFIKILKNYNIELLADIRSYPGSSYNPQFNQLRMKRYLKEQGINYKHFKSLGGLRKTDKNNSPNTYLRSKGFRAYADHMATDKFKDGLFSLMNKSKNKTTALMCAEKLPFKCHRWLLSDALVLAGYEVFHIYGEKNLKKHKLNPHCKKINSNIIYFKE